MEFRSVAAVDEYVGTMKPGEDWRAEIEAMYDAVDGSGAWFSAIGGVVDTELSFYDQTDCSYGPTTFEEPIEVPSCTGNVARLETEATQPYAYTHTVLARSDGSLVADHLNAGTVLIGEVYMRVFETEFPRAAEATPMLQTDDAWTERHNQGKSRSDPVTGLGLWEQPQTDSQPRE